MLYRVKKKTSLMNLKIKPEIHQEFRIAAELRGSTMSNLLHQFIVATVWEEKKKHPDAFATLEAEKEKPATPTRTASNATRKPRREQVAEALAGAFGRNGEELSQADRETIRKALEQEGSDE